MISIADNPAVHDPAHVLTQPQQDALVSIDFYRHQSKRGGFWQIGNKRVSPRVVDALRRWELLRQNKYGLTTTMAGKLAIEHLKGDRP